MPHKLLSPGLVLDESLLSLTAADWPLVRQGGDGVNAGIYRLWLAQT